MDNLNPNPDIQKLGEIWDQCVAKSGLEVKHWHEGDIILSDKFKQLFLDVTSKFFNYKLQQFHERGGQIFRVDSGEKL